MFKGKFKNLEKKLLKLLNYCGIYVLLLITLLLIITTLGWFFDINMSIYHLPISFSLTLIFMLVAYKKEKINIIFSAVIVIFVLFISSFISGKLYDQSSDGNSYHKEAVGVIASGYNPLTQTVSEFAIENNIVSCQGLWIEHYPKASWIYGASLYEITGNIETGKSFNLLIIFVVFSLMLNLLSKFINSFFLNIVISLCISLNPILLSQLFSYYIDGFLGGCLILLIFVMINWVRNEKDISNYLILFCLIIILCNLKFTGLFLAGIFCLGFYIYYIWKKTLNKRINEILKPTIFFIVTVMIAIFIVGYSSYVTNFREHGNPLYPLAGNDKIDIMTYLQPASFAKMPAYKKSFYSLFSKTANIGVFNNGEPELKIPFTYDESEIYSIGEDTRIGGFGVFFGGIFILSLIIIFFNVIKNYKKSKEDVILILIPIFIIFLLILFLSDGWWARYSPQIYFIPIIALIIIAKNQNKSYKLLTSVMIILITYNNFILYRKCIDNVLLQTGEFKYLVKEIGHEKIKIKQSEKYFTGVLFNLKDNNIKYELTDKLENPKKLYGSILSYEEYKK